MKWKVKYTNEFDEWWFSLSGDERKSLAVSIRLLEEYGPMLGFPHSSKVNASKYGGMRELRTQHCGHPLGTLYIFDHSRAAILLVGGDKTGSKRWYETNVPKADRIYDCYLEWYQKGEKK